jgi:hypothetical protein
MKVRWSAIQPERPGGQAADGSQSGRYGRRSTGVRRYGWRPRIGWFRSPGLENPLFALLPPAQMDSDWRRRQYLLATRPEVAFGVGRVSLLEQVKLMYAQKLDFQRRRAQDNLNCRAKDHTPEQSGVIGWRVRSLPVPDPQQLPPLPQLADNAAVRLFVERAAAVKPQFALTQQNAATVAQVCERLDGLPLALELAAARIEALSVQQLAARLDQRFRLLTRGSRTAVPRQQTLRATLDWSYELLSDSERRLFNRLSVFAGGWALDAAEAVGAGDGIERQDVIDMLLRLVRTSLVVAEEGRDDTARYRLPETVRQYAHEQLITRAEMGTVHARHASYYASLAVEAESSVWQHAWLNRLFVEHDNLRAALRWLTQSETTDEAIRLAGQLWPMWVRGGFLREGRAHLRALLRLKGSWCVPSDWAALVTSDGLVASFAGDYAAAAPGSRRLPHSAGPVTTSTALR